jgi:urocanate hydratase
MTSSEFIKTYASHPVYKAPVGNQLHAKSWQTEAPLRMLLNNLDGQVAENPDELVVYGGIGQAARNPESLRKIIEFCWSWTKSIRCWCNRVSRWVLSAVTPSAAGADSQQQFGTRLGNWEHFNKLRAEG